MLSISEKLEGPCCEKCGQSLPQASLTTREKINALKSDKYGTEKKGLVDSIVEILLELEARPSLTVSVPSATQTPPYVPPYPLAPYVPCPNTPWPNTGDPLPTYPRVTCRNVVEDANTITPTERR